ncbi:MAG: hypothetical protein ACE15B_21425 [Bryobacteraceae bacterium]
MKTFSWLVMLGMAPGLTQFLTFDNAPYGKTPPGWTATCTHPGSPAWEVLKDPTAPSKPYVLGQVSPHPGGDCYPLAIFNTSWVKDGEVSVKFKPVGGKQDQTAGVVWRYRDPNNYYVARADVQRNNVIIYRIQNGVSTALAQRGKPANRNGVKREVDPNVWSILKVAFKGPLFSVYYDHRRILQAEDATFREPGKVGLWTKADSVTYFDDFRVVQK